MTVDQFDRVVGIFGNIARGLLDCGNHPVVHLGVLLTIAWWCMHTNIQSVDAFRGEVLGGVLVFLRSGGAEKRKP